MNPHLFVYGSLMSVAGHPMGDRLRAQARLLGAATIQGRLYRISWYPGAVEGGDPEARVHGEVYALSDPPRSLRWLDAYEGIAPGNPQPGDYERVERRARLEVPSASGRDVVVWVYLYRAYVDPKQLIADGRWQGGVP